MFFRTATYNRNHTLEAAHKAKSRGRRKKAIACYLKAIKANPNDLVAHSKVAPLLAETRQYEKSWASFNIAAMGFLKMGFYDKCIGVYRLAAKSMPKRSETWETIIRLQSEKGQKADAVKTALTGFKHLKGKQTRAQAMGLLRKAFEIIPWHEEVTSELARMYARTGNKKESLRLYEGLEQRCRGKKLRKVRGAIFRLHPSAGSFYRWVKAGVVGK